MIQHSTKGTGNYDQEHQDTETPLRENSGTPPHSHGTVYPSILATKRGIRAVKWSFAGLFFTAFLQLVVVVFSGSIALLADTIHNFGDALTAIPLLVAFLLSRRPPTRRFTYGYGRVEDLAGVSVVAMILASAILAAYVSIDRLFHPQEIAFLWAVAGASVIGFAGNEVVAHLRIRVGREIGSAALVADGQHARADGLTSLAVLIGAVGVFLGFPLADPLVGLAITAAILVIVWDSGKPIFVRLLDGVDPEVPDEIRHAANHVRGILEVTSVRVRWLGHRLNAEVSITVSSSLSVIEGHRIAEEYRHELLHHLRYLADATIHVDPGPSAGSDEYHANEEEREAG